MAATPTSGHSLFAGQSAVVEGVHVDDLLRFHQGRGRRLVSEPPLALEGDSQLVHHGTAEGPLWRQEDKMGSWPPNTRPATAAPGLGGRGVRGASYDGVSTSLAVIRACCSCYASDQNLVLTHARPHSCCARPASVS